jgi:hypothetical protein
MGEAPSAFGDYWGGGGFWGSVFGSRSTSQVFLPPGFLSFLASFLWGAGLASVGGAFAATGCAAWGGRDAAAAWVEGAGRDGGVAGVVARGGAPALGAGDGAGAAGSLIRGGTDHGEVFASGGCAAGGAIAGRAAIGAGRAGSAGCAAGLGSPAGVVWAAYGGKCAPCAPPGVPATRVVENEQPLAKATSNRLTANFDML